MKMGTALLMDDLVYDANPKMSPIFTFRNSLEICCVYIDVM